MNDSVKNPSSSTKENIEVSKEAKNLAEYIRLNQKTAAKGNVIKEIYEHEMSTKEALWPLKAFLENKPNIAEIVNEEGIGGSTKPVLYFKNNNGDLKKVEIDFEKISEFKNSDPQKNAAMLKSKIAEMGFDTTKRLFNSPVSDLIGFINNAILRLKIQIPEDKEIIEEKLPEAITSIAQETAEKVQKITITSEQIAELKKLTESYGPFKIIATDKELKAMAQQHKDMDDNMPKIISEIPPNTAWFSDDYFDAIVLYIKDENNNFVYKRIPLKPILEILNIEIKSIHPGLGYIFDLQNFLVTLTEKFLNPHVSDFGFKEKEPDKKHFAMLLRRQIKGP